LNWWLWAAPAALSSQSEIVASAQNTDQTAPAPTSEFAPQWLSVLHTVWPVSVLVAWLLGLIVCGLRVASGFCAIRRLERRSVALESGPLWQQSREVMGALHLRRPVALRMAAVEDNVVVPLTWGWRRPVVLLPSDAETWPSLQRHAVLLHELAHVARWDWATQLSAQAACAFYWFHPLVWLGARSLRAHSERATDDRVLSAGMRATDYGECLLGFVKSLQATQGRRIMKLAIAMARPSSFEDRLSALLDGQRDRRGVSRSSLLVALCLTAVTVVALATVRATNQTSLVTAAVAPPVAAAAVGTSAAVPATSQTVDLSSPEATLRSFIAALNRYDLNAAASCVEAGKLKPMFAGFSASLREFQVSFALEGLQTSRRGDQAVVSATRFVSRQFAAGAPPERQHMTQEAKDQKVQVRRRAGKWRLLPPQRLAPAEPEMSLPRLVSLFGMTQEVESTMRTEAWEKVCLSNMRQLALGVIQLSFIADKGLRFQPSFKESLAAHIRSGGHSGSTNGKFDPEPLFHCPADQSGKVSYSFNVNLEGMKQQDIDKLENPRRTVLLYEGENGQLDFRHNGHAHVSFTDGSTQIVDREQAQSLHWK
jgi:beta-lactamase regulating signal transducer with metallopeptidase domain